MNPVGLYAECSTMGTIVILVVYLLTNLSLPVFMWRHHRATFSAIRHVVLPTVGSAVLTVPLIELCAPGQPTPYNAFPFIALGLLVLTTRSPCTATPPPGRANPPRYPASEARWIGGACSRKLAGLDERSS
jgi:amino acid transporter